MGPWVAPSGGRLPRGMPLQFGLGDAYGYHGKQAAWERWILDGRGKGSGVIECGHVLFCTGVQ